jgi:hypothetical protein
LVWRLLEWRRRELLALVRRAESCNEKHERLGEKREGESLLLND